MKASKLFLPLLLVFSYTLCWAQHAPSNKSKYSVLGESGEEIYGTFDEYSNQYQNVDAIEPSGAEISVSSPASDANYGAQLPVSVQQIAGQGALNYLEEDLLGKLKYTREGWQKKESALPEPSVSTAAAKQTQELPPGILTKLPFESELSLSGRKLVGIDYTSRSYDKPQDGLRNNTSNFKMNQELQMKILGKVGDRLSINVDYDDTVNKKDISLVYKGQPGEFVQQAAFGDITVTLPTTEFTGYSKELFGLKVDTQYKRLATNVFFSQTKGASEVKRFKGNYMLQRMTIADTSYIRFKYFSIQKPAAPQAIKSGSARVFIDYQNLNPALNISVTTNTVLQPLIPGAFSYRGNFVLLTAGQDYTIDYNTGVLAFKNILASNYAVAIDYQYADNSWLSSGGASPSAPLIIKDPNNTAGVTTELKTFYSLGNLKIQRDNGRGNFILALKDLNGNAAASIPNTSGPDSLVPLYPPVNGYQSNITVDFENGVFNLNPSTGTPLHDDLYTLNNHRYNFVTEYHYMIKILTLRPGIVPKSEKVVIDGAAMQQNADYIIDYDLGILTIVNDSKITENSVIDISYDYSMLGSSDSTLIGARSSLNLTNNISMGASLMYDFSAKGSVLPDIRSTPTSLMVAEGDVRITDLDIDALNLRVNAGAEYAVSSQNNNASGKAVIDSMDSSVYEDAANLIQENWFHSAAGNPAAKRNLWELNWRSYNVNIRDIDPDLELVSGQQQLVSEITYDVTTRSQAAFAQRISVSGLDFSKKLYIDVWIKDNGSTANFALDYATSINEDADGDGILDTEDKDGNGVLSPWEDTGQEYHNVDGSVSLIGARNGKLDTEDLNGNGLLDTYEDISGSYMLSSGTVLKNVNGWKQIRIPLNIDPSYDPARWQNVRMLRLRVVRNLGESGTIVIGKIAISGNRWEKSGASTGDFEIASIGSSNAQYVSMINNSYYRSLYELTGNVRKDERALQISYNALGPGEELLAKSIYAGQSLDISQYDSLRFFVYAKHASAGDYIIFRAGGSDDNYFEYKAQVTADASWQGWKLITIKQSGAGRAAKWSADDPSAAISVQGTPSLQKISQFVVGVQANSPGTANQVWFNEIHVTGSKSINGAAWKTSGNLMWKGSDRLGAVIVGADRKQIDKDFQTIAAGVYNRDYTQDSAYMSFEGVKMQTLTLLPVKAGISRVETVTPNVIDNNSNLISLNEEGKVTNYAMYGETALNLGVDLPQFTAQYERSITDTSQIERLEDRESITGSVIYNNPLVFPVLPTNVTARARQINSYYKVYPSSPVAASDSFLGLDAMQSLMDVSQYHTLEQSNMFSVDMPFRFAKGIKFSPSYIVEKVSEKNHDFAAEQNYNKTLNQTAGASLVLGIVNWFSPTFTYSINTKENYDVNGSTDPLNTVIPGQKKYVERNGVGEISWNVNAFDISASKYLKSLVFSAYYRLQDSDSYDNVDKDFDASGFSVERLWIRNNVLMKTLPSYSISSYVVKTVMNRNDIRVTGRYMPFEAFALRGALSPLNSLSANFTFTEGGENSYVTGTLSDTYTRIWPDILLGMSRIEAFFNGGAWMSDSQLNFRYNNKNTTTYGVSYAGSMMYGFDYRCKLIKKLDLYFALENTEMNETNFIDSAPLLSGRSQKLAAQGAYDWGKWRFLLRYENENTWALNSTGKYSAQLLKNSYLGQINSDLMFPGGIRIPIINVVLPLKNRMIFLSNLKYITQSSGIDIEQSNNTNYGVSTNVDYEVSRYFRLTVGGSYDRYEFTYNGDLNYTDLTLSSKLTIQF